MPVDITSPLLQDGEEADTSITMTHLDEEIPKASPNGNSHTTDGSVDAHGNLSIKSQSGGWKACPFILGNEFCERLAYYGINTNLVVYLTSIMHLGNAEAAKTVTNWSGTCYLTTFLGAFLADSYWGRYWTIAILSIVYAIGMLLLSLAASVPSLKPPVCPLNTTSCASASSGQLAFFYTALYLIALGTGGIKPCVSSFGADQFDSGDPVERKHMTSFFSWFYFAINVGALIASSVLVYVQENVGWGVGFALPTLAMIVAIVAFFLGTPLYRNQRPGGSPLTRIVQVIVASFRKWRIQVPLDDSLLYEVADKESAIQGSRKIEHTPDFRFLDKAAIVTSELGQESAWKLCTVTQVEEVKIFARILPIWASTIIYFTVYSQMGTFFVEQGQRMDTNIWKGFKIPAASLTVFDTLTIVLCVPIYDRLLVPLVRHYTGHEQGFTSIQRMAIGLWLATLSMLVAAFVEWRRLGLAAEYHLLDNATDPVPMSILWQILQYFLIGASEIFTSIGQLEFFYDQSPDAMRSLGSALALSTVALGSYLSSFVVTVITNASRSHDNPGGWIPDNLNRGHLEYFFLVIALLSILNTLFFWVCSRGYKYKRVSY